MAEVSTGPTGIGIKRRLPAWMLGANAIDKSREPERKDKKHDTEEMHLQPRTVRHKAKPDVEFVEDKIHPQTETASELESSISVRCKTKVKTRKPRKPDIRVTNSFDNCHEFSDQKKSAKMRRQQEKVVSKKQNKRIKRHGNIEDLHINPIEGSDDEVELTVEDLISIAEEYVKADEEKRHQQEDTTCYKSKPVSPIKSVLDKIRLGGSIQEHKSFSGPSRCTTVIHGGPAETSGKEHENPPSSVASSNPSKTGDGAQDMLDLLLGPLLKIPPVNEAKPKSLTEDIRLECELNSKRVIQSVDLGREQLVAAPKKKKSSLKEQIALFLD